MHRIGSYLILCGLLLIVWLGESTLGRADSTWVRLYDSPGFSGNDFSKDLALDALGNVFVTGWGRSGGLDYMVTIKYSPMGDELWVKHYNYRARSAIAQSLALDSDGNAFVTGWTYGENSGLDYTTVKYTTSGLKSWDKRYNGPDNGLDRAESIAIDPAGNAVITGWVVANASYDIATIKYSPVGDLLWLRTYNGPDNMNDLGLILDVDAAGNVYVVGQSYGASSGADYIVLKYTSAGDLAWAQRYDGPSHLNDAAYSVAIDQSGNVIVAGNSRGADSISDYVVIKYSPDGDTTWTRRYDNGLYDAAHALTLDDDGNVFVTGESASAATDRDIATLKYSPDGELLWETRWDSPMDAKDYAVAITADAFGQVYVVGRSDGIETGSDIIALKYSVDGDVEWAYRYAGFGGGFDHASDVVVDSFGYVYILGYARQETTDRDFVTMKLRHNDPDMDGLIDSVDNCPGVANIDQSDADGDLVGDSCDVCLGFDDYADQDADGTACLDDTCPLVANPDQSVKIVVTGDANGDGSVSASDLIVGVLYVFKDGPDPTPCPAVLDANCDGLVNSSDILFLVSYTFKGGPAPCDVCRTVELGWSCP